MSFNCSRFTGVCPNNFFLFTIVVISPFIYLFKTFLKRLLDSFTWRILDFYWEKRERQFEPFTQLDFHRPDRMIAPQSGCLLREILVFNKLGKDSGSIGWWGRVVLLLIWWRNEELIDKEFCEKSDEEEDFKTCCLYDQLFDVDLQNQPFYFERGVLDLIGAMEWQLHLENSFLLAQVTVLGVKWLDDLLARAAFRYIWILVNSYCIILY